MSRTGVEAKPPWRAVPRGVRDGVERALGAPVARAMRIWGGYSATPTFRLRLVDGRRAFMKAASPASTAFSQVAHDREERVYRELDDVISSWAPRMLATFQSGDWKAMVLEDLGPKSVPPWTPSLARNVARALGEFHRATLERSLPAWLPRPRDHPAMGIEPAAWALSPADVTKLSRMAGRRSDEAHAWLEAHVPALADAAAGMARPSPHALLHVDVRSDNLRWRNGRLYLFDWPHAAVGPPEFDAAAFAQTVPIEGGPPVERVMGWYGETFDVDPLALDASVAAIAGYFARNAWAPSIPGLPRVRAFQRRQLRETLRWAAARLGLPDPSWIDALDPVATT